MDDGKKEPSPLARPMAPMGEAQRNLRQESLKKREEYEKRPFAVTERFLHEAAVRWGTVDAVTHLSTTTLDGEELPAILIPSKIMFATLPRLRKFCEEVSPYFGSEGPLQDAERRLAVITEASQGGIITIGFDLDGGVHATVDEMGGTRMAVRNQGSVEEALDALARGEGIYANDVPASGLVGFGDHDMDILARMHHMMGNALQALGALEWHDEPKLQYWTEQYDHFRALYRRLYAAKPTAKGENLGTKINLRDVLRNVQSTLVQENAKQDGAIRDTVWLDDSTTLFDYIEMALAPEPTDEAAALTVVVDEPAPRQQVGGRLWQLIDEYAQALKNGAAAQHLHAAQEALAAHIDDIGQGIEKPRAPQGLSPAMATPYGADEAPAQVPEKLAKAAVLLQEYMEAKYVEWNTCDVSLLSPGDEGILVNPHPAEDAHKALMDYLAKHLRSDLEIDFKNLTASMTVTDKEAGVIEVIIDTPPSRSFTDLSGKRFVRQELPGEQAMYVWDGKEPTKYDPNAPIELDVGKFLGIKTGRTSGAVENASNVPKVAFDVEMTAAMNLVDAYVRARQAEQQHADCSTSTKESMAPVTARMHAARQKLQQHLAARLPTESRPRSTEAVQLLNLLAVIHKDGGQFTDQHGIATSCASAEEKVVGALHQKQMLADTLGGILMASGMLRKDIDGLTGPQLVQFGEEFAASLERTISARNTPTHSHLSTLIGICLGWKPRMGLTDNSPISMEIDAAVEHLKDWPYKEREFRSRSQDRYTIADTAPEHDRYLMNTLFEAEAGLEMAVARYARANEGKERGDFKTSEELALDQVSKAIEYLATIRSGRDYPAVDVEERLPLVTPEEFKADVDKLTDESHTVSLHSIMQANAEHWDAFGKLAAVPWAFIEYAASQEPKTYFEESGGGCDGKHTDCGFCNHSLNRYGSAYETGSDKHDPLCFAEFARKLIAAHPAPEVPAPVAQIKEPQQVDPLGLDRAEVVIRDLDQCIEQLKEVKTGTKAYASLTAMQNAVRCIEGMRSSRKPFGEGLARNVVSHRFFKDLTNDERLKVFRVFLDNMQNVPDDEMQQHTTQRMLLNYLYEPPRGVEG